MSRSHMLGAESGMLLGLQGRCGLVFEGRLRCHEPRAVPPRVCRAITSTPVPGVREVWLLMQKRPVLLVPSLEIR